MFSKIIKHTAKAAVVGLGLLAAAQAHSAALEFDLSGVGPTVNGYGRDGIYIGDGFNNGPNPFRPEANWTFQNVKLSIDTMTGTGTVAGTMSHNLDSSIWTINTSLNGLVVRSGKDTNNDHNDAEVTRNDYNAGVDDLSTILSTMVPGTGVEWKSLATTVTDGSTSYSLTGFAMPDMGHANVAELMWFDNFIGSGVQGLIFDAWYKGDNLVGDTKALATSAVPIPAAAFLFAPALLGFLGLRRKAKQA